MLRWIVAPVALLAAACSPPAAQDAAKTDDMNMAEPASTAPTGPITGAGTVTAVDAAAGTISLDHGPIEAISWPAMSMQFTAENPAITTSVNTVANARAHEPTRFGPNPSVWNMLQVPCQRWKPRAAIASK